MNGSTNTKQNTKRDKRAAALRDNLRKRKEKLKDTKTQDGKKPHE